ncbi:MAG: MFS transporter [Gammaproteobacteria bacterium]|nr:MFS transporter [Gammaproteobacteria bacterium]
MVNVLTQRYPALGFARYRRYWFASFASVGATQLIMLGQGWLIFELSGSALQLGVLGAAAALPNIAMTLLGGVIADRFDKRIIMMCTSLTTTLLLALLAWLDYSGVVAVWHVLSITALISLVSGLDWPARVSIYPQLVARSAFMSAVALNAFIWQSTRMAMPALGGLIIFATSDTWPVFALGAVGFFVMFAVIAGLRVAPPDAADQSPLEQLHEGIRFIWTQDLFRWLLGITFIGMFFSQSYVQILPVFVDLLGSDETGFGYLLSAGGVGSVVGTLLIGGVQKHRNLGGIMLGCAALSVACLLGFAAAARLGAFYPALGFVFLSATFASVFMITSMTVLQLTVPDSLRGRVMGIHTMGYSLVPLGGLFLGAIAESIGASLAVVVGSSIYLLTIGYVYLQRDDIRQLDGQTAFSPASDSTKDDGVGENAPA